MKNEKFSTSIQMSRIRNNVESESVKNYFACADIKNASQVLNQFHTSITSHANGIKCLGLQTMSCIICTRIFS